MLPYLVALKDLHALGQLKVEQALHMHIRRCGS